VKFSKSINLVGAHAEGEVGNVIVGGVGQIPGETMLDKRNHLQGDRDWIRQLILQEPRGAVVRSVNLVLPSNNPEADMGYIIMESTEYPVMSGSNTMCVATVLLETGMLPMIEPVTHLTLESPAGLIYITAECQDGKVKKVKLVNQPAFVYQLDAKVEVEGFGTVNMDIAWGGMAYCLVDARSVGFKLSPDEGRELCVAAQKIKTSAAAQISAVHPIYPEYPGITQVEFTNPLGRKDGVLTAKNCVVVSPGRIDRSPCGTGTSARLAVMHSRGEIEVGERFIHESIIGTFFESAVEGLTDVGGVPAVIPSVAGQAWITDISTIVLDPSDPFQTGYTLSDSWMNVT
jgi:proline racemase